MLVLGALLVIGCSCSQKEGQQDSTVVPPPDLGPASDHSILADLSKDTRSPDRGYIFYKDLGPVPDINLAQCRDIGPLPQAADAAASLAVKPALKWTCKLAAGMESVSSPVVGDGGTISITGKTKLHAVSSAGKLLWSIRPRSGAWLYGAKPLAFQKTLVFGTSYSMVESATMTGKALTAVSLDGPFNPLLTRTVGYPVLGPGGMILVGGADSKLYTIDYRFQFQKRIVLPASSLYNLVVDEQGNIYTDLTAFPRVMSLSPSGKVRWSRILLNSANGSIASIIISKMGDVIATVGDRPGYQKYKTHIVALDQSCGSERWRYTIDAAARLHMVLDTDGTMYFQTTLHGDGPVKLWALTPGGKLKWSTKLENSSGTGYLFFNTIGPIGADGTLYTIILNGGTVGDTSGTPQVRAYSRQGKVLWNVPISWMSGTSRTPLLLKDGSLVFGGAITSGGATNTYLISVQTTSPGMARSAWPRVYHDNLNSSNLSTPL
jgi:hypothetical protein